MITPAALWMQRGLDSGTDRSARGPGDHQSGCSADPGHADGADGPGEHLQFQQGPVVICEVCCGGRVSVMCVVADKFRHLVNPFGANPRADGVCTNDRGGAADELTSASTNKICRHISHVAMGWR
jgi:hypothetical protein